MSLSEIASSLLTISSLSLVVSPGDDSLLLVISSLSLVVSSEEDSSLAVISSLLLIASKLETGLEIQLLGEITSVPYINMTLSLLNQLGIKTSFKEDVIKVYSRKSIEKQRSHPNKPT